MTGEMVEIPSREGGTFQGYLAKPHGSAKTAGVVIASSVHGIGKDHLSIADEIASNGIIALAPDLFWRTVPGALPRGDTRTPGRAQPREEKIRTGEADMTDALSFLRTMDIFDGRAIAVGFCYGGPYAILCPQRLGYVAGVSCHGSQMASYLSELDGLQAPVAIIWGDRDHAASAELRDAYEAAATRLPALEHIVLPGVHHGYMLNTNLKHFDQEAYDLTMRKILNLIASLPPA